MMENTLILNCANNCEFNNVATSYCGACGFVLCSYCDSSIHRRWDLVRHNRIDVKNMSKEEQDLALRKQLIYEIEMYADNLDEVNQVIETRIHEVKDPLTNIESNIHYHFEKLRQALAKREASLVGEVKNLAEKKVNLLRRQQALISVVIDKADRTIGFQDPRKKNQSKIIHEPEIDSIDELNFVLKTLQEKYVKNTEPAESADIPVHFDEINMYNKVNSYGMLAGPPAPGQMHCEVIETSAKIRILWEYPYCRRHYQYANGTVGSIDVNTPSYIDPGKVLFILECAVVKPRRNTVTELDNNNGGGGGLTSNANSTTELNAVYNAFSPVPSSANVNNALNGLNSVTTKGPTSLSTYLDRDKRRYTNDNENTDFIIPSDLQFFEIGRVNATEAWTSTIATKSSSRNIHASKVKSVLTASDHNYSSVNTVVNKAVINISPTNTSSLFKTKKNIFQTRRRSIRKESLADAYKAAQAAAGSSGLSNTTSSASLIDKDDKISTLNTSQLVIDNLTKDDESTVAYHEDDCESVHSNGHQNKTVDFDDYMYYDFEVQEYIATNLLFRIKAIIITDHGEVDIFNQDAIVDVKSRCKNLSTDHIMATFPNSKWTTLLRPFKIPDKFIVTKDFVFDSPFDENGVLYWLGTQKLKFPYQNPHSESIIYAEMSTYGDDKCSPYKFVCHTHTTLIGANYTKCEVNAWMGLDLGKNRKLLPNYYCLRHGRADGSYVLRNWILQARVSETSKWVTLRRHIEDHSLQAKAFSVSFWPIMIPPKAPKIAPPPSPETHVQFNNNHNTTGSPKFPIRNKMGVRRRMDRSDSDYNRQHNPSGSSGGVGVGVGGAGIPGSNTERRGSARSDQSVTWTGMFKKAMKTSRLNDIDTSMRPPSPSNKSVADSLKSAFSSSAGSPGHLATTDSSSTPYSQYFPFTTVGGGAGTMTKEHRKSLKGLLTSGHYYGEESDRKMNDENTIHMPTRRYSYGQRMMRRRSSHLVSRHSGDQLDNMTNPTTSSHYEELGVRNSDRGDPHFNSRSTPISTTRRTSLHSDQSDLLFTNTSINSTNMSASYQIRKRSFISMFMPEKNDPERQNNDHNPNFPSNSSDTLQTSNKGMFRMTSFKSNVSNSSNHIDAATESNTIRNSRSNKQVRNNRFTLSLFKRPSMQVSSYSQSNPDIFANQSAAGHHSSSSDDHDYIHPSYSHDTAEHDVILSGRSSVNSQVTPPINNEIYNSSKNIHNNSNYTLPTTSKPNRSRSNSTRSSLSQPAKMLKSVWKSVVRKSIISNSNKSDDISPYSSVTEAPAQRHMSHISNGSSLEENTSRKSSAGRDDLPTSRKSNLIPNFFATSANAKYQSQDRHNNMLVEGGSGGNGTTQMNTLHNPHLMQDVHKSLLSSPISNASSSNRNGFYISSSSKHHTNSLVNPANLPSSMTTSTSGKHYSSGLSIDITSGSNGDMNAFSPHPHTPVDTSSSSQEPLSVVGKKRVDIVHALHSPPNEIQSPEFTYLSKSSLPFATAMMKNSPRATLNHDDDLPYSDVIDTYDYHTSSHSNKGNKAGIMQHKGGIERRFSGSMIPMTGGQPTSIGVDTPGSGISALSPYSTTGYAVGQPLETIHELGSLSQEGSTVNTNSLRSNGILLYNSHDTNLSSMKMSKQLSSVMVSTNSAPTSAMSERRSSLLSKLFDSHEEDISSLHADSIKVRDHNENTGNTSTSSKHAMKSQDINNFPNITTSDLDTSLDSSLDNSVFPPPIRAPRRSSARLSPRNSIRLSVLTAQSPRTHDDSDLAASRREQIQNQVYSNANMNSLHNSTSSSNTAIRGTLRRSQTFGQLKHANLLSIERGIGPRASKRLLMNEAISIRKNSTIETHSHINTNSMKSADSTVKPGSDVSVTNTIDTSFKGSESDVPIRQHKSTTRLTFNISDIPPFRPKTIETYTTNRGSLDEPRADIVEIYPKIRNKSSIDEYDTSGGLKSNNNNSARSESSLKKKTTKSVQKKDDKKKKVKKDKKDKKKVKKDNQSDYGHFSTEEEGSDDSDDDDDDDSETTSQSAEFQDNPLRSRSSTIESHPVDINLQPLYTHVGITSTTTTTTSNAASTLLHEMTTSSPANAYNASLYVIKEDSRSDDSRVDSNPNIRKMTGIPTARIARDTTSFRINRSSPNMPTTVSRETTNSSNHSINNSSSGNHSSGEKDVISEHEKKSTDSPLSPKSDLLYKKSFFHPPDNLSVHSNLSDAKSRVSVSSNTSGTTVSKSKSIVIPKLNISSSTVNEFMADSDGDETGKGKKALTINTKGFSINTNISPDSPHPVDEDSTRIYSSRRKSASEIPTISETQKQLKQDEKVSPRRKSTVDPKRLSVAFSNMFHSNSGVSSPIGHHTQSHPETGRESHFFTNIAEALRRVSSHGGNYTQRSTRFSNTSRGGSPSYNDAAIAQVSGRRFQNSERMRRMSPLGQHSGTDTDLADIEDPYMNVSESEGFRGSARRYSLGAEDRAALSAHHQSDRPALSVQAYSTHSRRNSTMTALTDEEGGKEQDNIDDVTTEDNRHLTRRNRNLVIQRTDSHDSHPDYLIRESMRKESRDDEDDELTVNIAPLASQSMDTNSKNGNTIGLMISIDDDDEDDSNGYRYFRIVQYKGLLSSSHLACAGIELYGKLTEELT